MNRRGFLGAILATACAPAIVRVASLMPVRALEPELLVTTWPVMHGRGCSCFSCIVTRTLQEHSHTLAANVTRNNHLLAMMEPDYVARVGSGVIVPRGYA